MLIDSLWFSLKVTKIVEQSQNRFSKTSPLPSMFALCQKPGLVTCAQEFNCLGVTQVCVYFNTKLVVSVVSPVKALFVGIFLGERAARYLDGYD